MKKKSILFIHPFFPYPLMPGGNQALFNGFLAVKDELTVNFDVLCMNWENDIIALPSSEQRPLVHRQAKRTKKTIEPRL